jgi:hypothetical protein
MPRYFSALSHEVQTEKREENTMPAVLLNTLTASNSPTLQDTTSLTTGYIYYEITFDNVTPTVSGAHLRAQYFVDGAWANDKNYNTEGWGNDSGGNNANSMVDTWLHIFPYDRTGPTVNMGVFGNMTIYHPSEANVYKCFIANIYAPQAYNNLGCQAYSGGSYQGNKDAVTGIQFSFDNGNINSGVIRIYGLK